MSNLSVASYKELTNSTNLTNTLRRAKALANQYSHQHVTLEHLLFVLLDDPDGLNLIVNVGADIATIRAQIYDTVSHHLNYMATSGEADPMFSNTFTTLMARTSKHVLASRKKEITGAFVTLSIAEKQDSHASNILNQNRFSVVLAKEILRIPQEKIQPVLLQETTRRHGNQIEDAPRIIPLRAPPRQEPVPRFQQRAAPPPPPLSPRLPQQRALPAPKKQSPNANSILSDVQSILDAQERNDPSLPMDYHLQNPRESSRSLSSLSLQADARSKQNSLGPVHPPAQNLRQEHRNGPHLEAMQPQQALSSYSIQNGQAESRSLRHKHMSDRRLDQRPGHFTQPATDAGRGSRPRPEQQSQSREVAIRYSNNQNIETLLATIPRKMRVGRPETIELRLQEKDVDGLFTNVKTKRMGDCQLHICRAVTLRLIAPEGGFFTETLQPETQWIFDKPKFLGDENFGRWIWTVIPNESGQYPLTIAITSRDFYENALTDRLNLPAQAINITVKTHYGRIVKGFTKCVFFIAVGVATAIGAYYALKVTGKLPHFMKP